MVGAVIQCVKGFGKRIKTLVRYSSVVHGPSSWGSYSLKWGISPSLFLSLHPLLKLIALKLFLLPKLGTPLLPLSIFLDHLTSGFREVQGEGS